MFDPEYIGCPITCSNTVPLLRRSTRLTYALTGEIQAQLLEAFGITAAAKFKLPDGSAE